MLIFFVFILTNGILTVFGENDHFYNFSKFTEDLKWKTTQK